MNPQQWLWLPLRLGVGCMVTGAGVIAVLWWGAGEQVVSYTQLPYALVAGGAGLGLVLFGAALCAVQRRRLGQRRLEDAIADVLVAAARLADGRSRRRTQAAVLQAMADDERWRPLPATGAATVDDEGWRPPRDGDVR